MTTDVQNEAPTLAEEATDEVELRAELERLVELKKEKLRKNNQTPCPACTTYVPIKANKCPYCNTDIAANNALIRETLRRLEEITADLDGEHARQEERRQEKPVKRSLSERLKGFFAGRPPQQDSKASRFDTSEPRILSSVSEGDLLKVIEYDEPWYKIKTRNGQTGWVYSTLVRSALRDDR